MLHFHPTDPRIPPVVDGDLARGLLRIDFRSVGGDTEEFELTALEAMAFGQRLMDSAAAMLTYLKTKPRSAS